MLKESGYAEKFVLIAPWMQTVVEEVKKDLKNEHLRVDRTFSSKYFLGKNPAHISSEELAAAYEKEIAAGNVGLGEFIATRWLLKHTDIYYFFETHLKKITPDFENLTELSLADSETIQKEALKQFSPQDLYLFCVFNSVVFPSAIYEQMRQLALKTTVEQVKAEGEQFEKQTIENLQKRHAREMEALRDRLEKKISGLQRKYIQDTDNLKKQISLLHKKLSEKTNGS